MEPRLNAYETAPNAMKALYALGGYVEKSSLELPLQMLLSYRVSQLNGCAFCLDMHSKDLRAQGETEQRLYGLDAWHDAPYYSDRERAALAWAEALTTLRPGHVPDGVYEEARLQFSSVELVDLTMAVVTINGYNRVNIAFRTPAGDYQPGQYSRA
ncbi:MAG: carboxymuconolactone decarboxylase family protein [Hymenobacter sp.]|nr:carboxymuconolactone decarboxylase family protein [Hymenobacter sp.]